MRSVMLPGGEWWRSSRCDVGGCVWVARSGSGVRVRDEARSVLEFTGQRWSDFIAAVKADGADEGICRPRP